MPFKFFKPKINLNFLRQTNNTPIPPPSPSSIPIPNHFLCPISLDLMKDPVTLPSGITYDRRSIETWLENGKFTCPLTNLPLLADDSLVPNHTIRHMIQEWCVANRSLGVERIATPKIPVTSLQVSETLAEISEALNRGDADRCSELVHMLTIWSFESERNRRRISSNGLAARIVSEVFKQFPSEQCLSLLAGMLPVNKEAMSLLSSKQSLKSIVCVLKNGNLRGRYHAISIVREIASFDTEQAVQIGETEGLIESILKLLKEPISPQATKAAVVAAYHLIESSERVALRLAEMGIVTVLLEMLVDAEKSLCEKGLILMDGVLKWEIGREKAGRHGLAVPVLVKKMFGVSDVATEFAVSAMWRLCKKGNWGDRERCLEEAVKVGAFQKLLILLQVGCSDRTKEKANELLRILNGVKGVDQCIESADFKYLKRPV